jgi:hypothetical protein
LKYFQFLEILTFSFSRVLPLGQRSREPVAKRYWPLVVN